MRIRLQKASQAPGPQVGEYMAGVVPQASAAPGAASKSLNEAGGRRMIIKSPMVGTFYRAPAPDAPPFVEVGQEIDDGQVICIVEAMKLMNEIKSEVAGRVVEISVESGEAVEFGQPLFVVEPR